MKSIVDSNNLTWRRHDVETVGLLVDAERYYRQFYRAAMSAKRSILLSGWQFDSDVALLRGEDAEKAPAPVVLIKFLNYLCEQNPELQIRILAWDFHIVFAAEREWMQRLVFQWISHKNILFMFDDSHVENGSHHQKIAIIDDEQVFLGGLDLCDHRWDDSHHKNVNPLRVSRGQPHKPFHDIQAYVRSRGVAASLIELFRDRWRRAGGEDLTFLDRPAPQEAAPHIEELLPLSATTLTLHRTDPHGSPDGHAMCQEILHLYSVAFDAAEKLIYIETQYFSSHAVAEALERRLRAPDKPQLEVVLILNMKAETLKEQAAVGLAQAKEITRIRKAAAETSHKVGIYYTLPDCQPGETPEQATYIHSKLMVVDDQFLTVGSANLTNRSMSVDTELNITVETDSALSELGCSIQQARATLLGEHTGGPDVPMLDGLVEHLDGLADAAARGERGCPCRLRHHPSPTDSERTALAIIDPQALPFDPDAPESLEEDRPLFVGDVSVAIQKLLDAVLEDNTSKEDALSQSESTA
ncbi:MAG TPA: phospholipase D-like domain-containing protein [Polyangiales bacterium]|nr:phospholipase D-like domain-containing protein [Polyangiales bacterium]